MTDHRPYIYSSDPAISCYCCGRRAGPFRPVILSDKGWVCSMDDFCRAGTSLAVVRDD